MRRHYFVTGTDTGIGKTVVTVTLIELLKAQGINVCGMKPVSSGGEMADQVHISDDARLIRAHGSVDLPFHLLNPVALENPCAPSIAAEMEGKMLDINAVISAYEAISQAAQAVIVEGVGGWRSPCFSARGMVDMVKRLDIPVILVVGIKLGCINHALLSVESILRDNVKLAAWVANVVEPKFSYAEKTVEYIEKQIPAPLLGKIPYHCPLVYPDLGQYISVTQLIGGND